MSPARLRILGIIADTERNGRAHGGRITNRLIYDAQIDCHQMHPRHRHASADLRTCVEVPSRDRPWVIDGREPPAPDFLAFSGVHSTPAFGQRPRRGKEIAAGLLLERLPGGPRVIAESWVLELVKLPDLPNQGRVVAQLPMHDRRNNERASFFPKGHLIIQAELGGKFCYVWQRAAALRRNCLANDVHAGMLRVHRGLDALQRLWAAKEGYLGLVLHHPKPLAPAHDPHLAQPVEGAATEGLQKCFQFVHPAQPRVHVRQLGRSPISDIFALGGPGIFAQRPRLFPGLQRQRVVSGIVVLQAQTCEQCRAPGRRGVLVQKSCQARKIIRTAAVRIAAQRRRQIRILGRARLASDGHERLLEDAGAENLLHGRAGGERQALRRWSNRWQGAVRDGP